MKSYFLERLANRIDLSSDEAELLIMNIMSGSMTDMETAAILTAMRTKGESTNEILGFIRGMRNKMISITAPAKAVDTCGTGGDGKNTFNISTAAAIVAAACGITIAKHGNRASSSKSGSADVLEALGVKIHLNPRSSEKLITTIGIGFLFAPLYHPSMKHVAPVRKTLGIRTIFNILGPFVNPAGVKRQIIGVPNPRIAKQLASVASELSYEHVLIVTSNDGTDELSTTSDSMVFEIKGTNITQTIIKPETIFKNFRKVNDMNGESAQSSAEIIRSVLLGKHGTSRDTVCLNAGAAIYVGGACNSIQEGVRLAEHTIDNSKAKKLLKTYITLSNQYE